MSGGKAPKRRGDYIERKLVEWLRSQGIEAERVPLSGAVGGAFAGDIFVKFAGELKTQKWEVKGIRGSAKTLRKWLGFKDLLVIATHHGEGEKFLDDPGNWLVVMRLSKCLKK